LDPTMLRQIISLISGFYIPPCYFVTPNGTYLG
jgi:hypothetical protein